MGKKSGAPAPDYTAAANTQADQSAANTAQQTYANRPNQYSPFGNVTWNSTQTTDPSTGKPVTQWDQTTTLDPTIQGALNSQLNMQQGRSDIANGMMQGVANTLGQPMDYSQFQQMSQGPDASQYATQAGGNAFGFGPQNINTGLQRTPQLNASMGSNTGQIQGGLDLSGEQSLSSAADARSAAEKATYGSLTSRLDPQYEQSQNKLQTDLANRGISTNSDAYNQAMDNFNRNKTDAYSQANMAAVNAGGTAAQQNYGMDLSTRQQQTNEAALGGNFANNAQAQMFGQNLSAGQANNSALTGQFGMGQSAQQQQLAAQNALYGQQQGAAQFGLTQQGQNYQQGLASNNQNYNQQMQTSNYQNQLRQQQISEALQQRGMGLNEINALMSGQQVSSPSFSSFGQASQAATPDLLGAANAQYAAAQAGQSSSNAFGGQLLGAGSNIIGSLFSDRRVKADVRRIGTHPRGFGIYRYRYVGERGHRVGVMAQEVRRVMPHAVSVNSGVLMVDYSQLGGLAA